MSVINKEKLIEWVNTWEISIQKETILAKISEQGIQEIEEIDCPYCDGKGWSVEPDEENEPAQFPCQPCDLTGRVSTIRLKEFWAERNKELEAEHNNDLPF